MREIKFRAWDLEKQKMYSVATLSLTGAATFTHDGEPHLVKNKDDVEYESTIQCLNNHVLMQYTELKDKNGKEIYEGDIVTYYCGSDKQARPMAVEIPGIYISDNASDGYMATHTYEIIGNIYENPELPCQ